VANRITKVIFRGDISDLQAKMAVASKAIADTADKATGAGKASQEYRKHLSTLGTTAGAVGLAAAAGLGIAVAAAARFDSSMSKVQAATHETSANMDLLRAAAIKAGADTVFSATEAADAITALSKAGVQTKDILSGGLAGSLSLASAGELDVASAAEIAATAMTQFGLSGKDIPHIADLLAAAAGKAQGDVTDMANSLKYVGPVAHQMGISIEETTGVIAELASQGILGEQAGTSLRGMLTALTSPSKQAAQEMKNLGINLYDSTGKFVGMRGIAEQLGSTMGKLTNAERDQALGRIFGNEQITAARILYAGGAEAVDKWTNAVNDQGYAAETAAIKMNNLKGDLEQLRGSMETALIGLGEGDQGALRSLVQHITAAVNAFNSLPAPVKDATTALLGITAVTGGALWFGSKVLAGIAETRVALKGLGVEATTTRAALSGIGTGVQFAAILEGLSLVDAGLRKITHSDVSTSTLSKDLEALGRSGEVSGTLLKTFGGTLDRFGKQADAATSTLPKITNAIAGWAPGSTSVETASKNFKKLDAALAELSSSGHADEAVSAFDTLTKSAEKYGVSASDLASFFPQFTDEIAKNSGAANLMSDAMTGLIPATDGVTTATGALGSAVQMSAADLQAQAKALEENRKRALGIADSFDGLGKSVDDAKVSLDGWLADMEKQTAAMRDFTKNAQTAAKRGLDEGLIDSLEKLGPQGALRLSQLANATKTELGRANKDWKAHERVVDHMVDVIGGVPPEVTTNLNLTGDTAALAALARINREIRNIPQQWKTDYYVIQHNAISKRPQVADAQANADGGTIHHAAAGWTVSGPRDPYGDKVLAYLAPGEEVITNRHGEADRFRADRAAGRIPAYANGVSVSAGPPAGSGVMTDRLLAHRDSRDALLWAMRIALRETPIVQAPRAPDLLYGAAS
jgi:TP901 family phage tail tape measure protein